MNIVKEYAKTLAALIVGAIASAAVQWAQGTTPLPHTGGEWLQFAVTTLGPAFATWLFPNKITDKQIDNDDTVIRVDPQVAKVGSASIDVTANAGGLARDIDQRIRQQQHRTPYDNL